MYLSAIRIGDKAIGHIDIDQNPVEGTVIEGSLDTKNGGIGISRIGDTVNFPSHAHALDGEGNPTDYQEHNYPIVKNSSVECKINTKYIAVQGDQAGDELFGQGILQATQDNFNING